MNKIPTWTICAGVLALSLLLGCHRDVRERIFDMRYPNIPFTIPAGLSPGIAPRTLVLDDFPSNLRYYLETYKTDTSAIGAIQPFSASIITLDGSNLDFISEISLRICTQGSASCARSDEVFYIDRLQFERVGNQIRLLPTLINAKRLLSKERFKLELWFYLYQVSPISIPCRLEMEFEAVR